MDHINQRIHQLQVGVCMRPIIVCIKTLWDIKIHPESNTHSRIGFLCHDPHGQTLEGQLSNDNDTTEPRFLTVGDAYEFTGFSVVHNSRGQKLTQLPYFIRINQETTMTNVTDIGPIFPVNNFSSLKYSCLLRLADTPSYLPDVVGQIRVLQDIKPRCPEPNKKVTIGLLMNKWKMVKLTHWDKQAAEFNTLQIKRDRMQKVVIITSVIPQFVKGKLELSSSPATDFYFDKSIELIKNFRGRIRGPRRA